MPKRKRKVTSIRDKVRESAEQSQSEIGNKNHWLNVDDDVEFMEVKAAKGKKAVVKKFHIIPYWVTSEDNPHNEVDGLWYLRKVVVHYDIGAERKAYACPAGTIKKKCPICEHRSKLIKKDGDEDIIEALKPRHRELFNVIEDGEDEIKLYTTSHYNFGNLLEREIKEATDDYVEAFADIEGGSMLKVRFSKEKIGGNEYYQADRIDFLERDDFDEEIVDEAYELDKLVRVLTYKELKAIFLESDEDEEDEKEDEQKSRGRKRRRKPKQKSARKSRRKTGRVEEDEQEEEGDEKTKYRSRRGTRRQKPKNSKSRRSKLSREKHDRERDAGGECPYGHEFGKDCNEFNDCDDCDTWEDCVDERDRIDGI